MKSKKNKNKNLGAYYNFLVTFVMRNKKYQTKPRWCGGGKRAWFCLITL
jgi:hypothetical protein